MNINNHIIELDPEEIETLDRYWMKRSGKNLEQMIKEIGIERVVDILLGEAVNKIRREQIEEEQAL